MLGVEPDSRLKPSRLETIGNMAKAGPLVWNWGMALAAAYGTSLSFLRGGATIPAEIPNGVPQRHPEPCGGSASVAEFIGWQCGSVSSPRAGQVGVLDAFTSARHHAGGQRRIAWYITVLIIARPTPGQHRLFRHQYLKTQDPSTNAMTRSCRSSRRAINGFRPVRRRYDRAVRTSPRCTWPDGHDAHRRNSGIRTRLSHPLRSRRP